MSVYFNQAKKAWLYDFQRNGNRYTGYCYDQNGKPVRTKREAKDIENALKVDVIKSQKHKAHLYLPNAYTLGQACLDYFNHIKNENKNPTNEQGHIRTMIGFFGVEKPLILINKEEIDKFNTFMLTSPYSRKEGGCEYFRSPKTINRYLDTLKSIIHYAYECEKIDFPKKIKKLKEEQRIPTPIPIEDLRKIIENSAEHLIHFINISVNTGMRLGELTSLKKHQIYLKDRRIILDSNTKSRKGRVIFVNEECFESIQYFLRQQNATDFLITYKGHPIKKPRSAWDNAQRRAGLTKHYRIHDMRASFLTLLAQTPNASEYYVSMAAGHSSPNVTRRYLAILDSVQQEMVNNISINKIKTKQKTF